MNQKAYDMLIQAETGLTDLTGVPENDIDKKIYNASVNGKTMRGYVYDFNHWFKRIPNFRPEYVIFYLGINDRKFPNDELHRFYDEQHSTETYIKINGFRA